MYERTLNHVRTCVIYKFTKIFFDENCHEKTASKMATVHSDGNEYSSKTFEVESKFLNSAIFFPIPRASRLKGKIPVFAI